MRIPPLLLMMLIVVAMYFSAPFLPTITLYQTVSVYVAAIVLVLGFVIAVLAIWEFHRAKTTVDPIHVENTSQLVTSGVYSVSRSPMYVSFSLMLLAFVIYLRSPLLVSGVIFFVVYLNVFQIGAEENFMRGKFGADYEDYVRRVRRWI